MKSLSHYLAMAQSHVSAKGSYMILPVHLTEHYASTEQLRKTTISLMTFLLIVWPCIINNDGKEKSQLDETIMVY